ncbi:MAG TPA: 16S rRNA (guanine(966)-N(2))-methyltransferase RsmD [Rhodospirillaceae bacterium]|nr:16S rRNA (guanine(966)-N(2))-methyltransferase RsmD [Rhodospirillaceae bacterium]
MRIVSGIYGGRRLAVPKGRDIRPTSDKVRGAVFNMLRSRGAAEGAQVMDVFCGTGALGLEALSQGAAFCTFIDKNRDSFNLARQNVTTLGAENESRFILKDATKLGQRPEDIAPATLAFLDPPYKMNLAIPALIALQGGGWLAEGAVVVIEAEKGFNEPFPPSFKVVDTRSYGDTQVMLVLMH